MKQHFGNKIIKKTTKYRKVEQEYKETIPLEYRVIERRISAIVEPRDKAIFAALYGTAARVSEICGLTKDNIKEEEDFLVLTIPNKKHRVVHTKSVPIPNNEEWLIKPILMWKEISPSKNDLCNIGVRQIRNLCHTYFKTHPHTLRHSRLTHIMQIYRMDLERLRMIAGWTDLSPARVYLHLRYQELFKGFEKR